MVNAVELFFNNTAANDEMAIVFFNGLKSFKSPKDSISFGQLKELAGSYQGYLESLDLKVGDSILLFEEPSPRLYALIIAILASGQQVLIIEPWLSLSQVKQVIEKVKPKLFIAKTIGKFWGMRSKPIRDITHWTSTSQIHKKRLLNSSINIVKVNPDHPGVLTFTSGTSGKPKGVYRRHQFMIDVIDVLKNYLHYDKYPKMDLTVFTNLVLANLSLGKGSLIVPSKWPKKLLQQLDDLPAKYKPDTMACGPGFLLQLMEHAKCSSLKSVHIGGALTDCSIFEKAFKLWPNTEFEHIYGSSEAEPVAVINARDAVKLSREQNHFQCLALGKPIREITHHFNDKILWVTGRHVSPKYLDDNNANEKNKKEDQQGNIWHNMGDRINLAHEIFWYQGRDFQTPTEFALEQKIYSFINSSKALITTQNKKTILITSKKIDQQIIKIAYPQIDEIILAKIYRDSRHRARIDRVKTIRKAITNNKVLT